MKHTNILTFLLRFRSYAENTYKLLEKVDKKIGTLDNLITNHIMHRLATHERMLKDIHDVVVGKDDDSTD